MTDYTLKVQNLKCGGCANTITKKIVALDVATNVSVDVEASLVHFTCADEAQLSDIKNVLAHAGYPIEDEANPFSTKAKSFVSCAVGRLTD